MSLDVMHGRSVETVRAELTALETGATTATDSGALREHVEHLRREHAEARRRRQRDLEDELLQLPEGVPSPSDASLRPGTGPRR